jgi:hypothetical protein
MPTKHLDDKGQPCTRHAAIPEVRLYELATLGSRVSGFHHDAASKLQSLVMALDDLGESATSVPPELTSSIETARAALKDLGALFSANRALAKGPQRTRINCRDLLVRASERVGVKLVGDLPLCEVRVTVPALTHAFALLIDTAACGSHAKRSVDVSYQINDARAILKIAGPAGGTPVAHANEAVAIASFVIGRDEGILRCGGNGEQFTVELAIATPTVMMAAVPKP